MNANKILRAQGQEDELSVHNLEDEMENIRRENGTIDAQKLVDELFGPVEEDGAMTEDEIRDHNNRLLREDAEENDRAIAKEEKDAAEGRDILLAGVIWTPEWEVK